MQVNVITSNTPIRFVYHYLNEIGEEKSLVINSITKLKYALYSDYIESFFRAVADISYGLHDWYFTVEIMGESIRRCRAHKSNHVSRYNRFSPIDISKLTSMLGVENMYRLFLFVSTDCKGLQNINNIADFIKADNFKLAI